MKKILFLTVVCCLAVTTATFTSCNKSQNEPDTPEQTVETDYSKMVGTWTLKSYSHVVFNIDKNEEVENVTRDKGTLVVTKETNGDGVAEYFYTENFLLENGEEYSGKFEFYEDLVILRDINGFMRTNIFVYDFNVPVLTENEMKWTYDRTHTVTLNGVSHKEQVTETIVLTR